MAVPARVADDAGMRPFVIVLAALALVLPARAAGAGHPDFHLVAGGKVVRTAVCGSRQRVHLVRAHRSVPVRVRGARRIVVRVERCHEGTWRRVAQRAVRRRPEGTLRFGVRVAPGRVERVSAFTGRRSRARVLLEGIRSGGGAPSPGSTPTPSPPPAGGAPPAANPGSVVDQAVSFEVRNVNRSALTCSSDGATYRLSGHLVAPAGAAAGAQRSVTLYLHEFGFGEFFWRFPNAAYDYARQEAALGHASLVIDRLGYDASPGPAGNAICLGSQADMAHQVLGQLRTGAYSAEGGPTARFARVALAGHSLGGSIAEIESYSFADADALILFGWADQGYSDGVTSAGAMQGGRCAQGGEPAEPGRPAGYAFFASSPESSRDLLFHDAEPGVVQQAMGLRNRDPCGDANTLIASVGLNNSRVGEITVPVLLTFGTNDATFSDPRAAGEKQRQAYGASRDVSLSFIAGSGHAMTLERSAPQLRAVLDAWLRARGL